MLPSHYLCQKKTNMTLHLFMYILLLTVAKINIMKTASISTYIDDWDQMSRSEQVLRILEAREKWKNLLEDLASDDKERRFVAATAKIWHSIKESGENKVVKRLSALALPITMAMGVMAAIFGIYIDETSKRKTGHHARSDMSTYDEK